jgi:hypothetical protein
MKKALLSITLVAICFSCNYRGTSKTGNSDQTIEDSIKKLNLIRQQDSINRERIFEEKGDTIFANVLYGMNRIEAEKSIKSFEKELKHYDAQIDGFDFGTIHFIYLQNVIDYHNSTICKYITISTICNCKF